MWCKITGIDRIHEDIVVVVFFDNIDYRVLLENTIEKGFGSTLGNESVSL